MSLQMRDSAPLAAGSQGQGTVRRSGFGQEMPGMNHSSHPGLSLAAFH